MAIAPSPRLSAETPRQTFPRQLRLLHKADFDTVFQTGQRSADRYFTILFHPNALTHPRLGFAISKHKVRLAVGRNRLRRLVRESFRRRAADLPPMDLVVLARDATTSAANAEITGSLDKHWVRIAPKTTGNNPT
ncbi:MAG: ribonuclease P protein component [Gammaproteobacteria bacterium]